MSPAFLCSRWNWNRNYKLPFISRLLKEKDCQKLQQLNMQHYRNKLIMFSAATNCYMVNWTLHLYECISWKYLLYVTSTRNKKNQVSCWFYTILICCKWVTIVASTAVRFTHPIFQYFYALLLGFGKNYVCCTSIDLTCDQVPFQLC